MCGSNGVGAEANDTTGSSSDDDDVIRYADYDKGRNLPAIPEAMMADVLALAHTLHGHAVVGAILALVLHQSPTSRRLAMLPGHPLKPWDEVQMGILKFDTLSLYRQQECSIGRRRSFQISIRFSSGNQTGSRRGADPYRVIFYLWRTSGDSL